MFFKIDSTVLKQILESRCHLHCNNKLLGFWSGLRWIKGSTSEEWLLTDEVLPSMWSLLHLFRSSLMYFTTSLYSSVYRFSMCLMKLVWQMCDITVNGNAFQSSISNYLLPVHRKYNWFCTLISYLVTLINLLINLADFFRYILIISRMTCYLQIKIILIPHFWFERFQH